jgi:hypothetical protein
MISRIYFLVSLLVLVACRNNSNAVKNLPVTEVNAGEFYFNEQADSLPHGFSSEKKVYHEESETFVFPVIDTPGFEQINKFLKEEIRKAAYSGSIDSTISIDSLEEAPPVTVQNIPLTMYHSGHLISYGYLRIMNGGGMMRPFREYFVINYDTAQKRMIRFDDFFQLKTPSDTSKLRSLIYSEVGDPNFDWLRFPGSVKFAFDKESVYFFFDQFGVMGNPMGLVKRIERKYLSQFIRDAYK